MVDFWIMVGLVALGALGIAALVAMRARRRREHWSLFDVALAFAALLWVSGGAGALLVRVVSGGWNEDAMLPLVPTILISALGSTAAVAVSLALGRPWRELGFRAATDGSLVLALGLAVVFLAVSMLWVTGLEAAGVEIGEQQIVKLLREHWGSAGMVVAIVYGVGLAPILEEIVFRGFALPPLVRALGPVPAIAVDALAFGVLHLDDPVAVPPLAILGATLAWLRWRTQSLWPSFVLHFTNNLIAFLILLAAP
jgi:membrane protease YdiL (CAAX protease family)